MFILSYREKIRSEIPTGLCSIIVDRSFYEPERNDQQQFVSKLQSAFESEPVEDCVTHPAEKMIDEALNSTNRQYVYEWISELATDLDKPVMAASLLRCLSRRAFDSGEWCVKIVQSALASDHLEMRDAAVQAAESWAGAEIRKVLEQHSENVSWLRDYIKDVINDLK